MLEKMFDTFVAIVSTPVFQIELTVLLTLSFMVAWRLRRIPRVRVLSHHRESRRLPMS